jgi:hypothetical protein
MMSPTRNCAGVKGVIVVQDPVEAHIRVIVRRIVNFFCLQLLADAFLWCLSLHYLGYPPSEFVSSTEYVLKSIGTTDESLLVYDTLAIGMLLVSSLYLAAALWWRRVTETTTPVRGSRLVDPFAND